MTTMGEIQKMREKITSLNTTLRKVPNPDSDVRTALAETDRQWLWYSEMLLAMGYKGKNGIEYRGKRGTPAMQAAAQAAVAAIRRYPTTSSA